MLGKIARIWQNEAQNQQPYLVLDIDGQRYSLWDQNWIGKLGEGDLIEYDWKKAGKFRNITAIERVTSVAGPEDKDRQILRMSCLKSASTIFSNVDAEPKRKVQLTIAGARCFEKYVNDGVFDGPLDGLDIPDGYGQQSDNDPGAGRSRQPPYARSRHQ